VSLRAHGRFRYLLRGFGGAWGIWWLTRHPRSTWRLGLGGRH